MTSSASLSFCLNCLDIWLGTNELANLGKHCHWNVMCLGFYLSQRKRPLPSECVRVSPPRRFLLENFSVLSTVSILIPLRTNAYTKNCISGSVHFKRLSRKGKFLFLFIFIFLLNSPFNDVSENHCFGNWIFSFFKVRNQGILSFCLGSR